MWNTVGTLVVPLLCNVILAFPLNVMSKYSQLTSSYLGKCLQVKLHIWITSASGPFHLENLCIVHVRQIVSSCK